MTHVEYIEAFTQAAEVFCHDLAGKACWSVIAGPGTGSMSMLAFGGKIRMDKPVKNSTLSLEQREFDGEFTVFVKLAPWEIVDDAGIVCTSDDHNELGGVMLSGLHRLIGKPVVSLEISADWKGLRLIVEGNIEMRVTGGDECEVVDCFSLSRAARGRVATSRGVGP